VVSASSTTTSHLRVAALPVCSRTKRAVLACVPILAIMGVWMLAAQERAEARAKLLAGSPRIETIRVMAPREGRDAGRVVVWVRVDHARGTRRAIARERPETVHGGRVVARIGNASRVVTRRLDLNRRRAAGGYHLRFPRSSIRATAAQGGRRVPVSARVAQTVDLQSDGDSEDRAVASTSRSVPLASTELSIEPRDGYYVNGNGDRLQVGAGHVLDFFFFSGTTSPCGVGPADNVMAPIDPQTGQFSFTSSSADLQPPVSTTAQGTFTDTTDMTLDATVTWQGCTYHVTPTAFSFSLYGASAFGGDPVR
jgi:hypothetical protein